MGMRRLACGIFNDTQNIMKIKLDWFQECKFVFIKEKYTTLAHLRQTVKREKIKSFSYFVHHAFTSRIEAFPEPTTYSYHWNIPSTLHYADGHILCHKMWKKIIFFWMLKVFKDLFDSNAKVNMCKSGRCINKTVLLLLCMLS